MGFKKQEEVSIDLGRVVLFRDYKAQTAEEVTAGGQGFVEILEVDDVKPEYIRAGRYVLPVTDATITNSDDGIVYAYNVSLAYLQEIAHLGEVEQNIVVGQAFVYPGRVNPGGKSNILPILMFAAMFLISSFAIFAK